MSTFFVSHMNPIKRARIHKGSCPHCRNGQGQAGQDRNGSGNTGWSHPLDRDGAVMEAAMHLENGWEDVGFCKKCLPGEILPISSR